MAGRWLIRWTSTGVLNVYSDVVDVWPTDPRFIISTDDARSALSWPINAADPNQINDLRLYIAAATPVIEDIVGTVVLKSVTQVVQQGWNYTALFHDLTQLTSAIYADLSTVPADAYRVDEQAGLVYFNSTLSQNVTLTYTTGSGVIPQNVRLATMELVRHWWQIGRQGMRPQNGALPVTAEAFTPSGFAVPRRVIELCAPNDRIGGFA
jgi:hypothetical protein